MNLKKRRLILLGMVLTLLSWACSALATPSLTPTPRPKATYPGPMAIRPGRFPMNFEFYNIEDPDNGDGVNLGPAHFLPQSDTAIVMASIWDETIEDEVAVYMDGEGTIEISMVGSGLLILPAFSEDGDFPVETTGPVDVPIVELPSVELETILSWLEAEDWFVRATAYWLIGEYNLKEKVPFLIEGLEDQHWYVVKYAVQSLGLLGGTEAIEPLITLFEKQERHWTEAILSAMSNIGSEQFIPVLQDALENQPSDEIRQKIETTIEDLEQN